MTDPAIIEAAARALEDRWNNNRPTGGTYPFPLSTGEALQAIVAAVTPLIRAAALEQAAVIIENDDGYSSSTAELAAHIRALKEQP
jgi:hypothetical protein